MTTNILSQKNLCPDESLLEFMQSFMIPHSTGDPQVTRLVGIHYIEARDFACWILHLDC